MLGKQTKYKKSREEWERIRMKRIFKGYGVWISNNALLLTLSFYLEKAIVLQTIESIVAVVIISLLWFLSGHFIVAMFYTEEPNTKK